MQLMITLYTKEKLIHHLKEVNQTDIQLRLVRPFFKTKMFHWKLQWVTNIPN